MKATKRQCGERREIRDRQCQIAELSVDTRYFLVGQGKKALQYTQFVHDFQRRWMVSPRKSWRKSECFSNTSTSTPARARRSPSIIPAGPPPAMQHLADIDFIVGHPLPADATHGQLPYNY
jgi:hypothetical protein